jgi:hypothetical protein
VISTARALRSFGHRVKSLSGRKNIPADTRASLLEASAAISQDQQSLPSS